MRVSGLCMADASRDSLYLSLETCLRRVLRGVLYFPGCGRGFFFVVVVVVVDVFVCCVYAHA